MAKRLLDHLRAVKQRVRSWRMGKAFFRAAVVVAALLVLSSATLALDPDAKTFPALRQRTEYLGLASETLCDGLCQGCYCDAIINGQCYVNGHPSGCIGCVGNCTGDHKCSCKAGVLALCAAFFATPPVPFLLAAMALAGIFAVRIDRFNPDALRWRVVGGLTLYSAAALAYLAYSRYLAGIDAAAWAEAIGGQAEAQATLSQGRSFLNTLATWGLWLILPLGYLSLLVQSVLIHPPTESRPDEIITKVRTRKS